MVVLAQPIGPSASAPFANAGSVAGGQAFVLDTNRSFSASEIRQTVVGSYLLLEMNINGDIMPASNILIDGRTTAPTSSDFFS